MKIHTALKIGKFAFIVLFLAFFIQITLSIIYGYFYINPKYAGAYFYRYRVKYLDGTMAKSVYKKINKNESPKNELLDAYLDHVSGSAGAASNRWPYYSYNLQDTFVFDRNTWKIFTTQKMLDAELKFLKFRNDFICKMHDIKFVPNADEQTRKKATKIKTKFFDFPTKDTKKLEEFFTVTSDKDELKDYKEVRKDLLDLVKAIKAKPADYTVMVEKKTANVPQKLSEPLLKILNKVIPEFKIGEEDLKGFFYRMSTIKLKPIELHVLNRFYWYYFFATYDYDAPGSVLVNKNYKDFEERLQKLQEKSVKDSEGNETGLKKTEQNKMADYITKRGIAKQEIFFNDWSEFIASFLGTKGAVVDKKDDDRNLIERIFGMGVLRESALTRR